MRAPPHNTYNESAFPPPSSTGLVFAKRKKTPFRGPTLSLNSSGFSSPGGSGSGSSAPLHRTPGRDSGGNGSRSASQAGRTSGEIIEEEDEDEVEEVEAFSPVGAGAEETVWEEWEEGKGRVSEDWVRRKGVRG